MDGDSVAQIAAESLGSTLRGRRHDRPGCRKFRRGIPWRLTLTGVVLTKMDGDARGGAALSIRAVTGQPFKFLGVGEKYDAIEPFHPDRVVGRIMGMGDIFR